MPEKLRSRCGFFGDHGFDNKITSMKVLCVLFLFFPFKSLPVFCDRPACISMLLYFIYFTPTQYCYTIQMLANLFSRLLSLWLHQVNWLLQYHQVLNLLLFSFTLLCFCRPYSWVIGRASSLKNGCQNLRILNYTTSCVVRMLLVLKLITF